jgi:UDP-N-acetylglucosamine 2-epimerase (non-hydrolysing)
MAPVVKALRENGIQALVLATAQHRQLLDQMLLAFGIESEWDLNAMKPGQSLASITGALIPDLERIILESSPQAILAQGDTTTVFCAALSAFYAHIPFGHIEAGLRSGDLAAPFPEEAMRRLTSVITRWHFAPTQQARDCLIREGFPANSIYLTGNTVIDSLLDFSRRDDLPWPPIPPLPEGKRMVLITIHRRENFGLPLKRILTSIRSFAESHPDAWFVYPVHPNPNVQQPAREILGNLRNVCLTSPLDYPELVHLMKNSFLIFTDSGGIQEEAPALGVPVLIFREVTERPEAVECGSAVLVGSDPALFFEVAERLWGDLAEYNRMAVPRFPFGTGDSGQKIAQILLEEIR